MPFRFGSFELDEQRFELRRAGTALNVQPRVLEIILFLAKNRNRMVTKTELLATVWKDATVSEAALSQAIKQARAALGDDPKAPRFIETVRGQGFRFRGELTRVSHAGDAAPLSRRLRPFFGRQRETERLHLAANEARAGHGNVLLVHGPPGVGKTRLAQWFATHQRDAGSEVCWGGCREGQSAPPFWPWPEVLHRYTETRNATLITSLAHGLEPELAAVAPELSEVLGATATMAPGESRERAQSVIEAIATFLRRAAERAPLTLVLEDLHLADESALHMLELIARSVAETELMILGTFRSLEGAARPLLREACEGSLPHMPSVALGGLSVQDVGRWLSTASPTPLPDSVVKALHFSTEGLPLLVEALVDELPAWDTAALAGDFDESLGHRVRAKEILGRRIRQLDPQTIRLLQTAAVCGEEFPSTVLPAVMGEPLDALQRHLDLAQLHGILKPVAEGSVRFAHALIQELLVQELSAPERRQQHAAFARAFANQLADKPDLIARAAYHFLEAVPHADAQEAVIHAQKAAEWARARHAYTRAAEYYQRALDILDLTPSDPRQYAELLLALGNTQFVAGAVDHAAATLEQTFELTQFHGHYDLFCKAILIWMQLRRDSAAIDPIFHARIAEALQNVQVKDDVFAQLQVARAMSNMLTAPTSERVTWLQEALSLTRETADLRARLDVVRGVQRSHTRFTDGTTDLELAGEMLDLAIALRSPEAELEARQWRANALLELGRGLDYDDEVAMCRRRATEIRTPQATWTAGVLRVGQLFLEGSLEECERLIRDMGKLGQDLMGVAGFFCMMTQLLQVGLEGEGPRASRLLGEVAAGCEHVLALAPSLHALVPVVARARMYCGQPERAQEYLARVTSPTYLAPDPLDRNFLPAMACTADLACFQNDVAAAAVVSSLLRPHEAWHAVAGVGSVYFGPVSYWLGRLSLVSNRKEDAQRQFERARRESECADSVIYRAWADYYLARALPPGQVAYRHRLLESARSGARRCSLGRLEAALGR